MLQNLNKTIEISAVLDRYERYDTAKEGDTRKG